MRQYVLVNASGMSLSCAKLGIKPEIYDSISYNNSK